MNTEDFKLEDLNIPILIYWQLLDAIEKKDGNLLDDIIYGNTEELDECILNLKDKPYRVLRLNNIIEHRMIFTNEKDNLIQTEAYVRYTILINLIYSTYIRKLT